MSTAIATMDQLQAMAGSLVKSKLFGFETVEQAMSIMLIAQAEGRSPALAARDYHVIKGRPALKADAMLARFQQEGGIVEWDEYTDTKVSGRFSHPKSSPKPVSIEWTIDMAKRIGLAGRDNWKNYPRAMMRARVISEGVRTVYPGIAVGIYTVEETQDFEPRVERNITPTSGAAERVLPSRQDELNALAQTVLEWFKQGSVEDAYAELDNAGLDSDEKTYIWTQFDAGQRKALKEEGAKVTAKAQGLAAPVKRINDGQRKRLEARINELGLSRDLVKAGMKERFGKDHFPDLDIVEYDALDKSLDAMVAPDAPAPVTVI